MNYVGKVEYSALFILLFSFIVILIRPVYGEYKTHTKNHQTAPIPETQVVRYQNKTMISGEDSNLNTTENKSAKMDLLRFLSIFSDQDLRSLYTMGKGYSSLVLQEQTEQSFEDSIDIQIELKSTVEDIQEDLRQAQEEINKLKIEGEILSPEEIENLQRELQQALQDLEGVQMEALQKLKESEELEKLKSLEIQLSPPFDRRPFIGVSIDNLNFRQAYEFHYDYNYGVLVKGVVDGSRADEAGIIRDDIIMEFDGQRIPYPIIMRNILESKSIGDTVSIKIFRNENILEKQIVLVPRSIGFPEMPTTEVPSIEEPGIPKSPAEPAKHDTAKMSEREDVEWDEGDWEEEWEKNWEEGWSGDWEDWPLDDDFFSYGYGGGSWIPVYFMPDLGDLNSVLENTGFANLPESGILLHGGGGKGPIGNGWFIGGMGAGYNFDRKIHTTVDNTGGAVDVIRRMKFGTGFGGVTLDRRYKISQKFMGGLGFLFGGGAKRLEISQTSGEYNWNNIGTGFSEGANGYFKLRKGYLVFQPKAMLHYRITPWLSIRSEVGYYMGFSFKNGWEAEVGGDNFEVLQAPDSNFYDGITFTIGPWFGF